MKIRDGFVSNSSSSSFIIGVLKIKKSNEKRVKDFIESLRDSKDYHIRDLHIRPIADIRKAIENDRYWDEETYSFKITDKKLFVKAEVNDPFIVEAPFRSEKDEFLVVRIGNDEGDSAFHKYDEFTNDFDFTELDWDIKESWFTGEQEKILNFLKQEKAQYKFGTARNG